MNSKPILDPEEWIFSLSDVKRLYISMRRRLFRWAILGSVLAFCCFSLLAPKYKAEASFREGLEKSNTENSLRELLGGITNQNQPQAAAIMKSYEVLRPLIEKLGIQVSPTSKRWILPRIAKRIRENLKAENKQPLEDLDSFEFRDVFFEGEKHFGFLIRFTDAAHFCLYTKDRQIEIGKGVVGESLRIADPEMRLTLVHVPKSLKIGSFYPFQISHWADIANGLREQIKIKHDKDNKSIMNLTFCNRDRYLATRVLNELMSQYQSHLKREYDHVATEQLAYLEGKQEQIAQKMEHLFNEHTQYLSENLAENGVIDLGQEAANLLVPHQQMQSKLFAIELELTRLEEVDQGEKIFAVAEESSFSSGLNQISKRIQDLKQQRDLLELSLCQVTEQGLESKRDELKSIRNQRCAVEALIQEVDLGQEISHFDLDRGICDWARAIRDPEEREDFADYLENFARLLSMREKMLQERFFYGSSDLGELEGIDIDSARRLFLEYNGKLDAAEAAMRHYAQFKNEIPRPDFDIASLSSVLRDPLCQKVIADASVLGLQLKDKSHHSTKEGLRWEEEIDLQRKILVNHLDQLYKVEELNAALIREKMVALQRVSLDAINRQISVLHEQANDAVKQRRQALYLEKDLLESRMETIRSELAKVLPEKWRFEKWLHIKTEMVKKMMETVTEVAESKTITTHLHHVESKPLDRALIPKLPESREIRKMTLLGGLVLPLFLFCLSLIGQILKGFPMSLEKLKALRLPVLGPISSFCDGPSVEMPTGSDLDLLRQIALFAEGAKVIGLIGGQGPDYSYALGENLSRMSARSIVLRCDFQSKFQKEDAPGLLQVWKGETGDLPIRKGKGFDFITAGGYSPFGTEMIQSDSFAHFTELLKTKYDWVFLWFRAPLDSAESRAALRLCDKAVVTVSGEKTEELTPFVDWAYHEKHCRLTFITRS